MDVKDAECSRQRLLDGKWSRLLLQCELSSSQGRLSAGDDCFSGNADFFECWLEES